jgi:hypothetical protein
MVWWILIIECNISTCTNDPTANQQLCSMLYRLVKVSRIFNLNANQSRFRITYTWPIILILTSSWSSPLSRDCDESCLWSAGQDQSSDPQLSSWRSNFDPQVRIKRNCITEKIFLISSGSPTCKFWSSGQDNFGRIGSHHPLCGFHEVRAILQSNKALNNDWNPSKWERSE